MKKGFTLSEVLITLVIIGVVAAMTIPTLNNNTREMELKSKAIKTYSMLTQAMGMASLRGYAPVHKVVEGDTNNLIQWYDKYLDPNLVTLKKCSDASAAGWDSLGGCWSGVTAKGLNNLPVNNANNNGIGTGIIQVVLNDGTFLNIDSYSSLDMNKLFGYETNKPGIVVFFDVNGSKGPNKLGKDIYVAVYDKGTLAPAYVSKTDDEAEWECTKHSNQTSYGSGYACLKVVMKKSLK